MRILLAIGHPGHVHHFKNFIWEMESKGHVIKVLAVDKEMVRSLLETFDIPYTLVMNSGKNLSEHLINMISSDYKVLKIAKEFQPDIFVGRASPFLAHISAIQRKPYIAFSDTEHAKLIKWVTFPFADSICTPSCFSMDVGNKHIRYHGYTELAYLHPNRFTPNPAVLTEIGLTEGDPFIIVRFVSWQASHDVGQHGILDKVGLVKALEQYGRVLITSEGALPEELQPYQIRVSPEKLHDLLYYATLYVGDGGTTASEAAVLGTPAIFISTLYCGYQLDEEKYGLLYLFSDPVSGVKNGLRKAVALLNDPNLKENAYLNRLKLLEDKIDVTEFMVWFVENYPESCHQIKADPEKQYPLVTS